MESCNFLLEFVLLQPPGLFHLAYFHPQLGSAPTLKYGHSGLLRAQDGLVTQTA